MPMFSFVFLNNFIHRHYTGFCCFVLEHTHSTPNTPCLLPETPAPLSCPFLPSCAQHSPSALPKYSSHSLPYVMPHRQIPGVTSRRADKPQGAPVLGMKDHRYGSSFPEAATSPQLKCQQWAKSFQWTEAASTQRNRCPISKSRARTSVWKLCT